MMILIRFVFRATDLRIMRAQTALVLLAAN